jgi:hypothetical protein
VRSKDKWRRKGRTSMRHVVGGGRWETLFVELLVTRLVFHGASNTGCKMLAPRRR